MELVSKQYAFKQLMVCSSPRMKEPTMTQPQEIRRHPNGSIDTGHYAQIGHQRRSDALYDCCRAIAELASASVATLKRLRMPSLTPKAGLLKFRVGIY
jgi:hypothetical protein